MQDQEMKALVRGFMKWLLRVGLALNLILWLAVLTIYCQEKPQDHPKLHSDNIEQENEGGWAFITVTDKNGDLVFFYRENKKGVQITSMGWDKDSAIKDETKTPFRGCYFMLYCKKHLYIYYLQRHPCSENFGPFVIKTK